MEEDIWGRDNAPNQKKLLLRRKCLLLEEENIGRKTVKKLIKGTDCQGSSLKLSTVTLSLSDGKIPKLL